MRIWPCQAAPRDEPRVGHGRRGGVPQRSPQPAGSALRAPSLPSALSSSRPGRGGRCRSRSPVGAAPRRGPARPCPNMRRGSRLPPLHTMPGGCGGRARRGAAGAAATPAAAAPPAPFPQPLEADATPLWSPPRAAAGADRPGEGGRRGAASPQAAGGGAARPRLAGPRCRVGERRPASAGGRRAGRAALPKRAVSPRAQKPPFCFRCFLFSLLSRRRSEQMTYLCRSPSGAACASIFVSAVAFRSGAKRLAPPGLQPGPSTCPLPTERTNFS